MAFLPIGETLKQGSWRGPAKGVYLSLRVEKVLNDLLPKFFPSTDTRPKMHSLREGKLSLLTPSPTISQEVYLYAEVLKKKINEALEGRVVERVGFKLKSET